MQALRKGCIFSAFFFNKFLGAQQTTQNEAYKSFLGRVLKSEKKTCAIVVFLGEMGKKH